MSFLDWLFGRRDRRHRPLADHHLPSRRYGQLSGEVRSGVDDVPLPTGRIGERRYKPAGDWVQATTVLEVKGIHHRRGSAEAFCRAVMRAELSDQIYGARLRPEPSNRYDRNAIAVDGFVADRTWHIGYLDRDTAAELNRDLIAKGLRIGAQLYAIWISPAGYIEVKVIVLAPPGHSLKSRLKKLR